MYLKFSKIIRIFFLVVYALHASTPVAIYAVVDANPLQPAAKHRARDIVWANTIYSFFSGDDDDDPGQPAALETRTALSQPDTDLVLIRKKRALFRKLADVKPDTVIQVVSWNDLQQIKPSWTENEIARNPLLHEINGYRLLNSGLSPPSLLS